MTRNVNLQYFDAAEFGEWFECMSIRQLIMLDIFRHSIGSRVFISNAYGALGRRLGPDSQSAHNVDVWGEVLASDVFVDHIYNRVPASGAIDLAERLGFTGIGLYTDTRNNEGKQQPMFHLDVRPTKKMGFPALWGRVNGEYCSIEKALHSLQL